MNKSVLITGAVQGTGFAIADRFAKDGYDVFITSRNDNGLAESAQAISKKHGVFAHGYVMKTESEQSVIDVFNDIRSRGYLVDSVVLNAANLGIKQNIMDVALADFMNVFEVNIGWNFAIARQAALQMREKGKGSIVFIGSNTAYRAIPDRVAYGASKSGILGMARAMALDLGKYGIRVNTVVSGMIKTERWINNYNNCRSAPSNFTPIGDIAEFEDIANAAWFLCSDQSRNTTGAELTVDGGNMIQLYPIIPKENSR